jgi:hypothetical protein
MPNLSTTLSVLRLGLGAVGLALTVGAATASAATIGFSCITNNSSANCAIGTAQLTAELTDLGNGTVEFLFRNTGSSGASLTQIYFDQSSPTLAGLTSVAGSTALDLSQLSRFSGGNGIGVAAANGVNPGEWLRLAFTLNQGSTFASLLTSLATGDFRIGMHVTALGANGQSEAFVNQAVVPEPTSLLLLGTGLAAAAARRRKRQAAKAAQATQQ